MKLLYAILLFTILPLLELWLLLTIGSELGIAFTVGLVLVTGVIGGWLARREGLDAVKKIQSDMEQARIPKSPLLDGLLILVGAAFLLTPGLITDTLGFSLLIPSIRNVIKEKLKKYFKNRIALKLSTNPEIKIPDILASEEK